MRTTPHILIAALAAAGLAAGTARADAPRVICVADATCPAGALKTPALQSALSMAELNAGADRILLGRNGGKPYVGAFHYDGDGAGALDLFGSTTGGRPTITSEETGAPVLSFANGAAPTLTELHIRVPALTGATGIRADSGLRLSQSDINGDPAGGQTGIRVRGGLFADANTIDLPSGTGIDAAGGQTALLPTDVRARFGIVANDTDLRISGGRIEGGLIGVQLVRGASSEGLSFSNAAVSTSGPTGKALFLRDVPATIERSAIVHRGGGFGLHGVEASASEQNQPVRVVASLVGGYVHAFRRTSTDNVHFSPLRRDFSEWSHAGDAVIPGAAGLTGSGNADHEPAFVDRAGGKLALRTGDPGIDIAPKDAPGGISGANVEDGDGDGILEQDAGIFEYRAFPPLLDVEAPASGTAGRALAFSARGIDQNEEKVTLAWSFGDGATAAGSPVSHAYAKAGTFQGTVTARNETGRTSAKTFTVTVTGTAPAPTPPPTPSPSPSPAPTPTPAPRDAIGPRLSLVRLFPARLRATSARRLRLRVRTSEATRLTVTVRRSGVRARARSFTARIRRGTSRLRIGSALGRIRALRPGRYTLTLRGRDRAGNPSARRTVRMVVLKPRRRR